MSKTRDIQVRLYNPTQPQLDALNIIHVDKPLFTVLAFGRQTGKTYMTILDAITYALNNPKVDIMYVSPTYLNNIRLMSVVDKIFLGRIREKEMIFKNIKYKEQTYEFHNGSRIDLRSAEQGDALRGSTEDMIYIDETAFMKKSFIYKVLVPMVTRTGGRIVMTSTFNGRNWYYKLYKRGQDKSNSSTVISLLRTYKDLNDPSVDKVIEGLRQEMTKEEFLQEVMCRPVSKDTLFINVEDAVKDVEHHKENVCIGIDIGVSNDFTVVTVMNLKYEVLEMDRFNLRDDGLSPKAFRDRVMRLIQKYQKKEMLVAAYFEINNQELLLEQLEDEYADAYQILGFLTTAKNKPEMINRLISLFEEGDITIPNNETLIEELYGFKRKINTITGKIQYTNVGVAHDDTVMSLAIATRCVDEEGNSGTIQFY